MAYVEFFRFRRAALSWGYLLSASKLYQFNSAEHRLPISLISCQQRLTGLMNWVKTLKMLALEK